MLFGLDMLKRYQANIDLGKNALTIHDREIPFLPEHEIPKSAFMDVPRIDEASVNTEKTTDKRTGQESLKDAEAQPTQAPQSDVWPEKSVSSLTNLGIPQNVAKQLLNASNGNPEIAASIYFQNN